jgi:hypothetical protein
MLTGRSLRDRPQRRGDCCRSALWLAPFGSHKHYEIVRHAAGVGVSEVPILERFDGAEGGLGDACRRGVRMKLDTARKDSKERTA